MTRAVCLMAAVLWPAALLAQDQPAAFRPGHITISAGVFTASEYPVGDTTATLRRNSTAPTSPFPLLRAESDMSRAAGVEARVGVALSRGLEIEAAGTYRRPQLRVTISQDDELGGAASVGERIEEYSVQFNGVYLLPRISFGTRIRPYLVGGAGYLRQLHEGRLGVETGRTLHAGGGVRYWIRGGGSDGRSFGLRAEARLVRRSRGIEFEDRARTYPAASALAFVGF